MAGGTDNGWAPSGSGGPPPVGGSAGSGRGRPAGVWGCTPGPAGRTTTSPGAPAGARAHLGALRNGEVTSGAVRLSGISAAGLVAGNRRAGLLAHAVALVAAARYGDRVSAWARAR
ncbi:hypothetical protein GCM10010345_09330 [Streptomyces canarius]|uniref:Uncharacterized protein n=1 Tax=Streptomyces canarius TaxID=285453 RepID=A0ABQ3CK08_9ACTN|nr:hypothetical protein GCM10010345_09330 [Streptomyces canarius]